jgi:hypothetical protein
LVRAAAMRVQLGLVVSFLVSVYFFASGFLLSRTEMETVSTANSSPDHRDKLSSPLYKKLVVVIVDALRWDFARDRLPNTLFAGRQSRLVSLQFRSDPPTTTAQRLKGMTTGSLPTFIDVSRNFGSNSIGEDNWIDQLERAGKRVVVLGDDTWENLFPGRFTRKYLFPSFNVKDLDTVDNGVLTHFDDEFRNTSSWDVMIAHFLGVDHAGHTFGRDTSQLSAKLEQMDLFLSKLVPRIGKETLLVIMGDHGMTASGNHGGASEDELQCGLIVVSPSLPASHESSRSVPQVDLVPSLCLLLGLPIPFGNLGRVIPELFHREDYDTALSLNVWQVRRYVAAYAEAHKLAFPLQDLQRLATMSGEEYLNAAAAMCRSVWATFDVHSMTIGLICEALCILCFVGNVSLVMECVLFGVMVGPLLMMLVGTVALSLNLIPLLFLSGLCLGPLICSLSTHSFKLQRADLVLVLLLVLHSLSLFSNSFIESEANVNAFLQMTGLLVVLVQTSSLLVVWLIVVCFLAANFSNLVFAMVFCAAELEFLDLDSGGKWLRRLLFSAVFAFFGSHDLHFSWWTLRVALPCAIVMVSSVYSVVRRDSRGWIVILMLVLGPKSAGSFAALLVQRQLLQKLGKNKDWLMIFCTRACFFNSGHLSLFSTIQFESGFLGCDHPPMFISACLIVANTVGSFLLAPSSSAIAFVISHFMISCFCFFARRHLMVWRVFAPKYVFETVIAITVVVKARIVNAK